MSTWCWDARLPLTSNRFAWNRHGSRFFSGSGGERVSESRGAALKLQGCSVPTVVGEVAHGRWPTLIKAGATARGNRLAPRIGAAHCGNHRLQLFTRLD